MGTWSWDADADVVTWSAELAEICGVRLEEAPTTVASCVALVDPEDQRIVRTALAAAADGLASLSVEFRMAVPDGGLRWLRCRGSFNNLDVLGRRMLGVCQDVTEQRVAEENLKNLASHDALTGLPNRALFVDRLDVALKRCARSGKATAVLFLDLDRFKSINDTAGHPAGDRVLIAVADRLREMLRPMDSVARFGGDEFAILCEDLGGLKDAEDIARRVLEALAPPVVEADGRLLTTRASVGIAFTTDPASTSEDLLRDADAAMYQAKEAGRNQYAVFDNDSRRGYLARLQLADELHLGLDQGEFRVFYQPVISLLTNRCVGVEALIRWAHPERGMLAPGEFIAVAEETGAIVELGAWVLAVACGEAARQQAAPGEQPPFVAVNLSARQLGEPGLTEALSRILEDTGLDPARLYLEVTESLFMEDLAASVETLLAIRALGVQIAVDDFGTGFSSLSYLRQLPIDIVKIDRTFTAGVGINPADDAIVAAIVNLSHALGLRVVAEGVENEQQLTAVRALGCDQAQGFYWAVPVPADTLGPWGSSIATSELDEAGPVDLYSVLVERTDALRRATSRSVVLQAPQRLAPAVADLGAIKTIVDHLLGNAVTYSPADRPVLVSAAADRRWVRVSVADFGSGMTSDESARCFEQFWQGADSSDITRTGTGIGLYIVRSLVEAMGGHVGVKSAKGKGSTFTVALPRSARIAARSRPAPSAQPGVSEDSTIREFMRHIGVPNRRGS